MKLTYHKEAGEGRWFRFSAVEQMANIGSEVGRAVRAQGKDQEQFRLAVARALELFDLTMADPKWLHKGRLRELARVRELFCRAIYGDNTFKTTLADLDRYFLQFTLSTLARSGQKLKSSV